MSAALIEAPNTSLAWIMAIDHILSRGNECSNLLVSIDNPVQTDPSIHAGYEQLAANHGLRSVKQVAYTIFPRSLYLKMDKDPDRLFNAYNRKGGVFERLKQRHKNRFGWGSYFHRMTRYPSFDSRGNRQVVNQLGSIVSMLNNRTNVLRAAYTMLIQIPSQDRNRVRGGPCLNYVALQLEPTRTLNLLAVYRNHDFIERAYGNYLGLGHLMEFLCDQTDYALGKMNCLSSHATVRNIGGATSWPSVAELRRFVGIHQQ